MTKLTQLHCFNLTEQCQQPPEQQGSSNLWLNLDYQADGAATLIEAQGLGPSAAGALTNDETRPTAMAIDNGLFVSLRGVNLSPQASPEDMVSVRLFVGPSQVISTCHRKVYAIDAIAAQLDKKQGPTSPQALLVELVTQLTDNMAKPIDDFDDKVCEIEELGLAESGAELRIAISDIRRRIIAIKRYLTPQREALYQLSVTKVIPFNDEQRHQLRLNYEHTMRYIEEMDELKERAAVLQEQLSSRAAEAMNNRMYVLSIVAAVFLPLGFFTGLLGINVGGLPGTDNDYAFTIVCVAMVVVVAIQVWVFRKNKWF